MLLCKSVYEGASVYMYTDCIYTKKYHIHTSLYITDIIMFILLYINTELKF